MKAFWIVFFICHFAFLNSANGQVIIAKSDLNLRDLPNIHGNILLVIPKLSVVKISSCDEGWCNATFYGVYGYVRESYLRQSLISHSPHSKRKFEVTKYYTNSSGKHIQSPSYFSSSPSGATAECNDGTFSFSQSRRGTCSHHGGVKRWL